MTQAAWTDKINPLRLADFGQTLCGTIALSELPRLGDVLHDQLGQVDFKLNFGVDDEQERFVRGRVDSSLILLCQRCGEPMVCDLSLELNLSPVLSDNQARALPKNVDPWLVPEAGVSVLDLLEDELLLGLPLVAKHDLADAGCTAKLALEL